MSKGVQKKSKPQAAAGKGLLADAREIIASARAGAYRSVNAALVKRNWLLGKRIAEEELHGGRAEYGRGAIKELAEALTEEYGKGFDAPSLYKFVEFFRAFPILDSLTLKSGGLLSWTHYVKLLQVKDAEARAWYKEEAASETWSVRTLQRNISSQYYEQALIEVRGQKGGLDSTVAALYGVETRRINEAVRNNPDKFPAGYVVRLTAEEWEGMKPQFSTSWKSPEKQGAQQPSQIVTSEKTRVFPPILEEGAA